MNTLPLQTLQTILQETFESVKTESQIYLDTWQQYLTPIVEDVVVTTSSLPYELWLNNTTEFLTIYSVHLLVTFSVFMILFINYLSYSNQQMIIDNQRKMIDQIKETESMESFKLNGKLSVSLEKIKKMNKEMNAYKKTVEIYRALRHNKAGYFLLQGDPSSRNFRQEMKSLGDDKRYVNNKEYLVKLKHINKFDNRNISV